MATEVAKARSNDFKVKDEAAFRAWAASRDLSVWEDARRGYFSIYVDYPRLSDGWPHNVYNEETGESIDVDVPTELAAHLQDGSVAVLMQSGSMGFQCISGYAIAINSRGESVDLRLLDIYEMAEQRQLGADIQSI